MTWSSLLSSPQPLFSRPRGAARTTRGLSIHHSKMIKLTSAPVGGGLWLYALMIDHFWAKGMTPPHRIIASADGPGAAIAHTTGRHARLTTM